MGEGLIRNLRGGSNSWMDVDRCLQGAQLRDIGPVGFSDGPPGRDQGTRMRVRGGRLSEESR